MNLLYQRKKEKYGLLLKNGYINALTHTHTFTDTHLYASQKKQMHATEKQKKIYMNIEEIFFYSLHYCTHSMDVFFFCVWYPAFCIPECY